jgi:soluble lytic murein transglycosylase
MQLANKISMCAVLLLSAGATPAQENAFLTARAAFAAGDAARLERAASALGQQPLRYYADYYQLRLRLAQATSGELRSFLARDPNSFLSERLREEWLRQLGRARDWANFDAEFPLLLDADRELNCYALSSRLARGDMRAVAEAKEIWYTGGGLPQSCVELTEILIADGSLRVSQVWARIRLILRAGDLALAKRVALYLPADERFDVKALQLAASEPRRFVESLPTTPLRRVSREFALYALTSLARKNVPLTLEIWNPATRAKFSAEEQAYVWGWLAYFGARAQISQALDWYQQARAIPLSVEQLAWNVRLALRHENWDEVRAAVAAMPAHVAAEPAWVYWSGRAARAVNREAEAVGQFSRIAGQAHFYGQLAAEELGFGKDLLPPAHRPTEAELSLVGQLPGIRRALALFDLGLRFEATQEWNFALRGLDDQHLVAAAELARRHGYLDRAIFAAEKTVAQHDFGLRFPAPFRATMAEHTRAVQLEDAWVYGLIRQESRFVLAARSPVGASGLMQLMPATARWVARRIGVRDYRHDQVNQIETNILLGTNYLRYVYDRLANSPVLASAAYNAGPGRAWRWRGNRPMEGAIYAETIPIEETREYVKKVMSNTMYYAAVFGDKFVPLRVRLGVIPPRGSADSIVESVEGEP